ncbi:MAG: DegT/DnrJ/EryC1/StrS family aminotransferase [Syntrophorhabdales bacterium]
MRVYSLPPVQHKVSLSSVMDAYTHAPNAEGDGFMESMRSFLGTEHLFYVSSGRAALWLIMKALSALRPKKEVLIPAYTCPAVPAAILKAGLKPILVDINLTDFGFEHQDLEKKIGKETLAVVVVHLFGYPAAINPARKLCREGDVFLVEDAAQAFGNTVCGFPEKKLGLLGDAGFFSFGRGKPIGALHGGLAITGSPEIHEQAKAIYGRLDGISSLGGLASFVAFLLSSCLSDPRLYWIPQMMPFLRLGETHFSPDFPLKKGCSGVIPVLDLLFRSLQKEKQIREENSSWYRHYLLPASGSALSLRDRYPYLRYPLLVRDWTLRDKLLGRLSSEGTGAAGLYPCPLNELPDLKERLDDRRRYRNAGILARSLITLPVHPGVTAGAREKIGRIAHQTIMEASTQ